MIEIDGARGEGGGQIIRTALSLSALTGTPFRAHSIRAGRRKPGLKAQHLACVRAVARLSGAEVDGARLGASDFRFEPARPAPGDYRFDIGTAGSASLVLQSVVYPLASASAPSTVEISGGTHVQWSPSFLFLRDVWAWWYGRLGGQVTLTLPRAGFFPRGGGVLRATITPCAAAHCALPHGRGRLERVQVSSQASEGLPEEILERQNGSALRALRGRPAVASADRLPAFSSGTACQVLGAYEHSRAGFGALGGRGKKAQKVGREAARAWLEFDASDALLDPHMADQFLLPASLVVRPGRPIRVSTSEVTGHLQTNAHTIGLFLPVRITIGGAAGEPAEVVIRHLPAYTDGACEKEGGR